LDFGLERRRLKRSDLVDCGLQIADCGLSENRKDDWNANLCDFGFWILDFGLETQDAECLGIIEWEVRSCDIEDAVVSPE
jgi:hypothetical protein